jgi:hypothetical protein
VFTHWGIFTKEQSPLIVNYTFLFIGVMAASVASYAVLRLVGLTFVEVLLKLAHGWQDVRRKGHEIKVQEARQNLLHTHDNYVVYREPDGAITVVPIMTETMIRRAGVQVTEEAPTQLSAPSRLLLPGPCRMLDVLRQHRLEVSVESLFLALGKGNMPLTCTLEGFMHVGHDAPIGQGKTAQSYGEMVLLLKAGIQVILANPHFAPVDKKGRDWRPIAQAIETQGAIALARGKAIYGLIRKYETIANMLTWLSTIEIDRRFEMQLRGEYTYSPIYLFIDEWPAIVMRHPDSAFLPGGYPPAGSGGRRLH